MCDEASGEGVKSGNCLPHLLRTLATEDPTGDIDLAAKRYKLIGEDP